MFNREIVLKSVSKPEERLVLAKLLDKAELAAKTNKLVHSEFLDPHQVSLAEKVLAHLDVCSYTFYGGFPGAERAVAVFRPDLVSEDEQEQFADGMLKVLEVTPNSGGNLSHRDYLGSLMGLGIKREVTGDIIVTEEKCSIIILSEMAVYIAGNLFKVGNTGVSLTILDIMDLSVPKPKADDIKTTVATLRLDSFCAPAFGISRSKAAEFIKAGKVNLNWEMTQNPDKAVREGDTISLRGKGRAVLEKVGGRSRKDRIAINIKKFV